MSLIQFNSGQLKDLKFSLSREYLEANSLGAFSSSTIVNCHTRRYHGLLNVRQPEVGTDNYVLLSNLDETLSLKGEKYSLANHQYPGSMEPKGFELVNSFSLEKTPTWIYKFGGCSLKKELILVDNNEQLLIRYTLEHGAGAKLQLAPFTAYRRIHDLGQERPIEADVVKIDAGIKFKMDENFDSLKLQFSKPTSFEHEPLWFYSNQYLVEKERGYDFEEDLYRIGFFETVLEQGESIVFSASLNEESPADFDALFETQLSNKRPLTNSDNILNRAADQFISKTARGTEVCAGFHWFGRWGRDTFIALPGLTIARGKMSLCEEIIDTMMEDLEGGLLTNIGVDDVKEYNSVDASLWFFWTLCELAYATGDRTGIWKKYGDKMKEILQAYKEGTAYNIHMAKDGLLSCGAEGVALTWMDAKVDGKPVTPRRGKPVEINALWYNAIAFSLDCAKEVGENDFVKDWKSIKEVIEKNFISGFWSEEKGYLADVIGEKSEDWSFRPNQVFAVSLPYPLVKGEKAKIILEKVQANLYTGYGMKTLSSSDEAYVSVYEGSQNTRDKSYHQGIIWPWLLGAFCEAKFKVEGSDFVRELRKINDNFALEFRKEGLGSISELYHTKAGRSDDDVEGQLEGVGTISQAWSVSELIRINRLAEQYN
jgi:predicted glycogen debranching enzyme